MNEVLYKIHNVDVDKAGLGDYGKRGDFCFLFCLSIGLFDFQFVCLFCLSVCLSECLILSDCFYACSSICLLFCSDKGLTPKTSAKITLRSA